MRARVPADKPGRGLGGGAGGQGAHEGNQYFPPDAVKREYFKPSATHTTCPWKGVASYYDVLVDGETNRDAAWYYPEPKEAARNIKGYVAFWRGVKVES